MECNKCGWEWLPRVKNPKCCPRCKSRRWNHEGYFKCKVCDKSFLIISLHHIDGNHENNKKGNTILICDSCHIAIHKGIGRRHKGVKGGRGKNNNYGNWRGAKGQLEVIKRLVFYQEKLK